MEETAEVVETGSGKFVKFKLTGTIELSDNVPRCPTLCRRPDRGGGRGVGEEMSQCTIEGWHYCPNCDRSLRLLHCALCDAQYVADEHHTILYCRACLSKNVARLEAQKP